MSELPLLVRSGYFSFLFVLERRYFGVLLTPSSKEEILDYIAHRSRIQVNMVDALEGGSII